MKALKKSLLLVAPVGLVLALVLGAWGNDEGTPDPEPLFAAEKPGLHQRGAQVIGLVLLTGIFGYGAVLFHRRRGRPQGTNIRVIAVKPLGQREKVAVLEVLGQRMVLGITAHRISLLAQGSASFSSIMAQEDEKA